MVTSKIPIPEEFQSQLRYVDALDKRSDEEIISSLTKHAPITSEKNVWTFWHAGIQAMPAWCQRNITNWVRLLGPSWTVRVLDKVDGSPNNALEFISPELLPETYVKGTMTGPYTGPHSADFLRGAALWSYGGVWMDVGCILVRSLDKVCWDQLADESSPYTVSVPWMYGQVMANHFVASRKGDPFVKHWHDFFMYLWKGQKDHTSIVMNPLVSFVQNVRFEDSVARGFKWDFKVDEATVMGYIGQCVSWLRLCMIEEPDGGFNGAEYYEKHVLLFDSLSEDWPAETVIGFLGKSFFDVLKTRRDADPESEEYKSAYETIWKILTKASMEKVTHGKHLTKTPALGLLLDEDENQNLDIEPGTFAELLRYGSVHFEQTRKDIDYVKAEAVPPEERLKEKLF